jgi:hypothetical protein
MIPKEEKILPDQKWNYLKEPVIFFNEFKLKATLIDKLPSQPIKNHYMSTFFLDAESVDEELLLTGRREGDKIHRIGSLLPTKVKKLIINKKLTDKEKAELVFVRNLDGEILLIADLAQSKNCQINKKSRKIIQITVENFKKACLLYR